MVFHGNNWIVCRVKTLRWIDRSQDVFIYFQGPHGHGHVLHNKNIYNYLSVME